MATKEACITTPRNRRLRRLSAAPLTQRRNRLILTRIETTKQEVTLRIAKRHLLP
ncbi:MAG: hypothetical protein IJY03_08505 [Prevotella sp.]|nr:hypothetical protein [Prevotella sp.]